MTKPLHPLLEGTDQIMERYRHSPTRADLFATMFQQLRGNWLALKDGRQPSKENWKLRTAKQVTLTEGKYLEKQLQKAVVRCLDGEGWFNDVPTASGLVNSGGR